MFDNKQPCMTEIERKFQDTADEVKAMHKVTDNIRTAGAAGLGIFVAGLFAAPFTGGMSLTAAAAVGAAGAAGGFAVVGTNVRKTFKEKESIKEIETLGNEFLEIVKPLRDVLEKIMKTCEKLEEKSKEAQAADTLADLEALQKILQKVAELRSRSGEVIRVAFIVMQVIKEMVVLLISMMRIRATPEEDKKLIDSITESSRLCSKVTQEFREMKEELQRFYRINGRRSSY